MMHWDWFALFLVALAFIGFAQIAAKLDRIIRLLEVANKQRQPPPEYDD